METNTIERIEERLLERRRAIINVLTHLKRENDEVTEDRQIDWLDRAADENVVRTVDRLTELYRGELDTVEDALARIRVGTFGTCTACHDGIEPTRLELFPQTLFCAGCADLRESFERAA